jgi:hypothetical protein
MTKTHLITSDSYINQGIGLKHGDPTISIRIPVDKKEELEALIDRLIALGGTKNKQDFLRAVIFKAMDEHRSLSQAAIGSEPEPTPKKAKARKPAIKS